MATYNGEKFVEQQIKSIILQSYKDWKLIIRDDNSSDRTKDILLKYVNRYPDKIKILDDNDHNLGIVGNFERLLQSSTSEYICFCDQDDVWLSNKLEVTLDKMKILESKAPGAPILVHTDMEVVDVKLNLVSKSFFKYQNINPSANSINRLMVHNTVTGCTLMINSELRDKAMPFPKDIVIHDWYLALLASAYGLIDYKEEATVMYRQHGYNELGAVKYGIKYFLYELKKILDRTNLLRSQKQAAYIKNDIAKIYSNLNEKNWFVRKFYMFKYGFYKKGFVRNIGLFLKI